MKNKKILLGVTGSIAAYKACDIVRRLQDEGADVTVVMTKSATQFVTPLTFSGLTAKPVLTEMFDDDQSGMPHIHVAQEADLFLIAPATANIIGKLAGGIADDLLTCMVLSTKAPIMIVPAMNDEMYSNVIVQKNCQKLKKCNFNFIEPIDGLLACGTSGKGHLAPVDEIIKQVEQRLSM